METTVSLRVRYVRGLLYTLGGVGMGCGEWRVRFGQRKGTKEFGTNLDKPSRETRGIFRSNTLTM